MLMSGFAMSGMFFGLGGFLYFKEKNRLGLVPLALGVAYLTVWSAIVLSR